MKKFLMLMVAVMLFASTTLTSFASSVQAGPIIDQTDIDVVVDDEDIPTFTSTAAAEAAGVNTAIDIYVVVSATEQTAKDDILNGAAPTAEALALLQEAGLTLEEAMNMVGITIDIEVVNYTGEFTATVPIRGVTPEDRVIVLHFDETAEEWEVIPCTVLTGAVRFTYYDTSPFAFFIEKAPTSTGTDGAAGTGNAGTTGTESPKTGETNITTYVAMTAVVAMAAVVLLRKKEA